MSKKETYLVEIEYHESGESEVITMKTDDLAWSMTQYQRTVSYTHLRAHET